MYAFVRSIAAVAVRLAVSGACLLSIWQSYSLMRADSLFKRDTEASIRSAIVWAPDGWSYYLRLAQFDHAHARELLDHSLRLNRFDAQAEIELALQFEAEEDYPRAEQALLSAYAVDNTYLPRWSLANYYLRRDNTEAFWVWARRAAEMPSEEMGMLFELCWRISPDPQRISAAILNDQPELVRQYVTFLLGKDQPAPAALAAMRLLRTGKAEQDRAMMFEVVNRLIAASNGDAAARLWRSLTDQRWIVADQTLPNNADFQRQPLLAGFDWALMEYPGLHSWPGAVGLETEFAGGEPEDCLITKQALALRPGEYSLAYSYHTAGIPPATGIRWQVVDPETEIILGESPDLSSESQKQETIEFKVPAGISLVRLQLRYQRALGTPRVSGTLVMTSTRIEGNHLS